MSAARVQGPLRIRRWGTWGLGVCAGLALATCFKSPPFDGPYRCLPDGGCGDTGMRCDDGICCRPGGEPWCPTYVADGGTCEDGGAPQAYFLDEDGDGYGRDDAWRWYCIPPVDAPYAPRGGDCNDALGIGEAIHPGAPELCDGIDNNCDGILDDGLAPQQQYFFDQDDDGYGNADAGVWACAAPPGYVPNDLDCAPADPRVGASSYDQCDGLDNNCNGATDERPDCGGPSLFTAGVNVGVKRLVNWYSGQPPSCLKDANAATGTPDSLAMPGMVWTGTGPESHVLWVEEADPNTYWDLSDAGTVLKLRLSESTTGGAYPTKWATAKPQPVVLLCGPAGFVCYWHMGASTDPQATPVNIFPTDGGTVTNAYTYVYLREGNGWQIGCGAGNLDAVLRQVSRVEILVEPYGSPTFTIDLDEATFGFQ